MELLYPQAAASRIARRLPASSPPPTAPSSAESQPPSSRAGLGLSSDAASNITDRSGRGVVTKDAMLELDRSHDGGKGGRDGESEAFRIKEDVVPGGQYEYLPHTADVQLHSWGSSLASALEHLALAMFGYMVDDLGGFEPAVAIPSEGGEGDAEVDGGGIVVTARDAHTLVFSFLDEWLVHFHLTQLVPRRVQVLELRTGEGGGGWGLTTRGRGEKLDLKRHKQGTEVKAITYSAMRVLRGGEKGEYEIFVIIDI
ncbi:hypothetical protein TeGR_g200 [Tetraparma gracilis]|uniref:Archease domain-containing protein n=1 Tax=Tetraparma gracilis TaxID=2962635 RepID=A0ABQ6MCJ7_9STRA|nr:hypothetical protein TeGR_g200 [Tetraparma gracilis]